MVMQLPTIEQKKKNQRLLLPAYGMAGMILLFSQNGTCS
jgi:hypothetical protein